MAKPDHDGLSAEQARRTRALAAILFAEEAGEPRFSNQDLLGAIPFLVRVLGAEDHPEARALMKPFAQAAGLHSGMDDVEREAAIASFCEANPPSVEVVQAVAAFVRELMATGSDDDRARIEKAVGTTSGQAVLSALAQDGPGLSPMQILLNAKLNK